VIDLRDRTLLQFSHVMKCTDTFFQINSKMFEICNISLHQMRHLHYRPLSNSLHPKAAQRTRKSLIARPPIGNTANLNRNCTVFNFAAQIERKIVIRNHYKDLEGFAVNNRKLSMKEESIDPRGAWNNSPTIFYRPMSFARTLRSVEFFIVVFARGALRN
jgi:hypothetical protein